MSDIDMVDSSDTAVDFDEEEDKQLLLIDPIHDQEDAGPSGTAKTLPPTASFEAFLSSSRPIISQPTIQSTSRPVKRKVTSTTKKGTLQPGQCPDGHIGLPLHLVTTARTCGTLQVSLTLSHNLLRFH
ncbi:hypothetical protein ATANTOWER_025873 [Ataeniobius toweri]|uniref:Uncharacterized protein n=1 Tax=Ataeniobius toweri TaxID=208326 RepID=A0ABU7AZN0_9TELE|nr:hypothetical protein [Ataeniobius toweri]